VSVPALHASHHWLTMPEVNFRTSVRRVLDPLRWSKHRYDDDMSIRKQDACGSKSPVYRRLLRSAALKWLDGRAIECKLTAKEFRRCVVSPYEPAFDRRWQQDNGTTARATGTDHNKGDRVVAQAVYLAMVLQHSTMDSRPDRRRRNLMTSRNPATRVCVQWADRAENETVFVRRQATFGLHERAVAAHKLDVELRIADFGPPTPLISAAPPQRVPARVS
jgi:hypothetical protein